MFLDKHIAALAFMLVAFLATAEGSPGSKSERRKGAKKSKSAKDNKSSKDENSDRTLKQSLQDTLAIQDALRERYNYSVEAKNDCIGDTDIHRMCIYDLFKMGGNFECECRPLDGAEIFEAVDVNNDEIITLEEIQTYFATDACEPTFIYQGITYNGCTTAGDSNGREWCSIRVLHDNTHAVGFFKYCNAEDNVIAWQEALEAFDTDDDGFLSFHEAIIQRKERRRRLQEANESGGNCNDCDDAERMRCLNNPIIATIDGECRNYIKTTPFDGSQEDENLLQMLGAAMVDSYDSCAGDSAYTYLDCPIEREGMDRWMTRTHLSPYPETDSHIVVLSCLAIAGAQTATIQNIIQTQASLYVSPVVASAGIFLLNSFLSVGNAVLECERVFTELTDGRDALQWGTYEINQGLYTGKTILAFMGTKPSKFEQLIADAWSVPLGNDMMRNMTDDAVQVALSVIEDVGGKENLFITGHSLGGIVAELVCSELGIEGASFGAIGAYDPYSLFDQTIVEEIVGAIDDPVNIVIDDFRSILLRFGYESEEIEDMIGEFTVANLKNMLISAEYNGLIHNTAHAGVKFEVVKNEYDFFARLIGSIDGSQCSHISSSCDVRKLWFEATGETTVGHASWSYEAHSTAYFTRGWEDESQAIIDYDRLFLTGVTKNLDCDRCLAGRDEWCDSDNCYADTGECRVEDKLPTFCPSDSRRAPCDSGDDCQSGRCDGHEYFPYQLLGYAQCYEQRDIGDFCTEDSDCLSDYCNWFWRCA